MKTYGAVDVGGTKSAVGLVSQNRFLESPTLPTAPVKGADRVIDFIKAGKRLDRYCLGYIYIRRGRRGSGRIHR